MIDFIIYILAAVITLPILLFFITLLLLRICKISSQRAFKLAADFSTFWFILSVIFSAYVLFKQVALLWIIMVLIILLALHLVLVWKKENEVQLKRAFLKFWRTSFLLFFSLYSLTVLVGIFQRV